MSKSGFIAIVGRPNAGKSTLLNAVLGSSVSIVTAKAQTTRNRVLGILTDKQGQIVFMDTPGIHRAKEGGLNQCMVNEAKEALEAPSLVWYLVDPNSALEHEIAVLDLLASCRAPVCLLFTKADLKRRSSTSLEQSLTRACAERGIKISAARQISARSGKGVSQLLTDSWSHLDEGPRYYPDEDQLSDRPTRFFVGEMIREQLLLQLGDEVPYSCAVEIEKFDEKSRPPRIEAVIYVERDSQKGIVIGNRGQKIKEIGQAARKKIETFIDSPIYLGLQVKLLKNWTKDAQALKRMGYHLS